jgi:hypothetical protein
MCIKKNRKIGDKLNLKNIMEDKVAIKKKKYKNGSKSIKKMYLIV